MSDIYQKAVYEQTIDINGNYKNKYFYCHYDSCANTYCIKDDTGSTLINMCFEDTTDNKMIALWKLYNWEGERITQEEYENIRTFFEDY